MTAAMKLSGIPGIEALATPQGAALFAGAPDLQAAIVSYAAADSRAEHVLQGRGLNFVGCGDNSEVWQAGATAIKVSTYTTGRDAWESGQRVPPENLLGQFVYMHALGERMERYADTSIRVPAQYFALRTPAGNYVLAQEYMEGWEACGQWARSRQLAADEWQRGARHIKARLRRAVGGSALRFGLADLELSDANPLHNLLVPQAANSLQDAALCIIDQPRTGLCGRLGIRAAKASLGRHGMRALSLCDMKG